MSLLLLFLILLACSGDKGGGDPTDTADGGSDGGGGGPLDEDGDGYTVDEDCDDQVATVHPGAYETCWDGVDQDCDGVDKACEGVSSASWGVGHVVGSEDPDWDKTEGWQDGPFTLSVGWEMAKVEGWLPDGGPALIVTAPSTSETSPFPLAEPEGNAQGAFYVVDPERVHGKQSLDGVAERRIHHEEEGAHLGASVDSRDLDGDGVDELVVLAGGAYVKVPKQEVWLLSGMPDASGYVADFASGPLTWEGTGHSINQVRLTDDLTGDDLPDLVMGFGQDGINGGVMVVDGSNLGARELGEQDIFLRVERSRTTPRGVTAGDLDGDGIPDLSMAALTGGGASANSGPGEVFVFLGPFDQDRVDADADAHVVGEDVYAGYFGYSLIASKDLDGDGRAELLACAKYVDNDENGSGRAYVMPGELLSGSSGVMDVASLVVMKQGQPDEDIGLGIQDGGDINGDGHRELIVVGANSDDSNPANYGRGSLFVFQGPVPTGTVHPDDAKVEVMGEGHDSLGNNASWQSLLTDLDLNGDGFDDWMAAGPSRGTFYGEGIAYLWYGAAW